MLINLSNHPSCMWPEEQLEAAAVYGETVDIPFPSVNPFAAESDVAEAAEMLLEKIIKAEPAAVLCQGEFSLAYAVISRLIKRGVTVIAACSERRVQEEKLDNGEIEKVCLYKFIKFRRYT